MVETAVRELEAVGLSGTPAVVLADAGYWKSGAIEARCADGIPNPCRSDADWGKELA